MATESDPDDDTLVATLSDAEHAHNGVAALAELLAACPVGHQVTACLLLELVELVQANLSNAVDGLRAMAH